jgi:hypothetical protein
MAENFADHSAKSHAQVPTGTGSGGPDSGLTAHGHILDLVRLLARGAARETIETPPTALPNRGPGGPTDAPDASLEAI